VARALRQRLRREYQSGGRLPSELEIAQEYGVSRGTIRDALAPRFPHLRDLQPIYRDFRPGDVRHSQADISKAQRLLGYAPTHRIADGLRAAMDWYVADLAPGR
jgi:nucleoside-diphosphate-sugar epimerase